MVEIIFEAHGTSLDNEANKASGYFDVDLSPLGEQQARELGQRYKNENFDAIFCSDLKRSYKTAELAFANRDFPIIKDAKLRECDYGNLTGHPSKEEVEKRRGDFIKLPFPNGESYEQTTERMKSFLQDLINRYDGKKVLIIGHRATQYGLDNLINGEDLHHAVVKSWQWQPGWIYKLTKLGKEIEK